MTWDEIAKIILEMPESERTKTAFVCDDAGEEVSPVNMQEAGEDWVDFEGVVRVKKGEFFFQ